MNYQIDKQLNQRNNLLDQRNNPLGIRKKKNKIYIVDNIVLYPLSITDSEIVCICQEQIKINNSNKTNSFCKHILYFMNCCKLDTKILKYFQRLKKQILEELSKADFQKQIEVDNKNLWKIAETTLFNDVCCCCLNPMRIDRDHHVCDCCGGIIDEHCHKKWIDFSDRKGCMMCRQ